MTGRFPSKLAELWRDRRGAYALEFGICAIPFFGLVFAFFETSYIYYYTDALQQAVSQAARAVQTGVAQAAGTQAATPLEFAQNFICGNAGIGTSMGADNNFPSYLSCGNLFVNVQVVNSFSAPSPTFYLNTGHYCPGAQGAIVVLQVAYPLPVVFPLSIYANSGTVTNFPGGVGGGSGSGNTSVHPITATAVFKNEPYTTAATGPCLTGVQ